MAWEKAMLPVKYGGLGFGSLRDINLAMLAKWWWRSKTESNCLWRKLIWTVHSSSRAWNPIPCKALLTGPWKHICSNAAKLASMGIDLSKNIVGVVGTGTDIAFWTDSWIWPEPLSVMFPLLFQLDKNISCSVAERSGASRGGPAWVWDWKRQLNNAVENLQFQQLSSLLQQVAVTSGKDKWVWCLDDSGQFNVASIKKELVELSCTIPEYVVKWNSWIPKKVVIVAWRAQSERLPTRLALSRRGVPIQNVECAFCGISPETSDHIFVACEVAQEIWQLVFQWCKAPFFMAFSLKDILDEHVRFPGSVKKKIAFHAVCLVTIWSLWNARNELIFSGKLRSLTNMIEEVKAKSFLWIKNRAKMSAVTWEQWRSFDVP
ncbi:putative reverse transcriptase zinc-binding domain-containing protein [Helianthus annuus]|nr:putative reverse transcriptase zinc-binding domain-containing protein [Helianthus annuus]